MPQPKELKPRRKLLRMPGQDATCNPHFESDLCFDIGCTEIPEDEYQKWANGKLKPREEGKR